MADTDTILPPGALGEDIPPPPKQKLEEEPEPEDVEEEEAEDEEEDEEEDEDDGEEETEVEDDESEPELPEPTPPPRKTRKKPVARRGVSPYAPPPEEPLADAEMHDYDTWVLKWDWTRPNMKMKINRLSPSTWKGKPIAGFIIGSERENDPWTLEQIAHTFGGGTYKIQVTGIDRKGKNRMLSSKQIKVAGDPRITRDSAPAGYYEDDDDDDFPSMGMRDGRSAPFPFRMRPGGPPSAYSPPPLVAPTGGMNPEEDSKALSMIDDQFKWMRDNLSATNRTQMPSADTGRQLETNLRTLETVKTSLEAAADRREKASADILDAKDRIVDEHKQIAERKALEAEERVREAQAEKVLLSKEAQEKVAAAHEENRGLRDQMDKLREDAQRERERIAKEAIEEKERIQREMSSQATEQRSTDQNMMAMLLGNQQTNSAQQLDSTMKMFESRLMAAETAHNSMVNNLTTSYENRLQAQATLFQSQFESLKQTYAARESQVSREQDTLKEAFRSREKQMEREVLSAREEAKQVRGQLEDVRNTLLVEIQRTAKTNDPTEQLGRMGTMLETLSGFKEMVSPTPVASALTGEDGDVGDGIDNPAMKTLMQLGNKIVGVIPNITDAISARAAAQARQAMPPPGMMPPHMMQGPPPQMQGPPPQQQRRRGPPQQMSPGAVPGPAPAQQLPPGATPGAVPQRPVRKPKPKKPGKKISRDQLDLAVVFINGALDNMTPPSPEDFARSAQGTVDNDVLRELARRPPERVVHELDSKGILIGTCATPPGKAYIVEMLTALKPLVLATARPKSLPDPEPEPETQPAPESTQPETSE